MSILAALLLAAPQAPAASFDLAPATLRLPTAAERPVLFDEPAEGEVVAVGATWKATFDAEGVEYVPFFGSRAPRNFPVRFRVGGARVAGQELEIDASAAATHERTSVTFDRGAAREVWHLAPERAEQTFVFDQLPTRGELVVGLDVATELTVESDGGALVWSGPYGSVTYGAAVAIDADGDRVEAPRVAVDGGFELRVPADFVAAADLPLVIDPIVTSIPSVWNSINDQDGPAAAFGLASLAGGHASEYLVVWEEHASGADSDIFSVAVSEDGVVDTSSTRIIEGSSTSWYAPSVAFHRPAQTFLVVAEVLPSGSSREVRGRIRHLGTNALEPAFTIAATPGIPHALPRVGGYSGTSSSGRFFVVWERRFQGRDVLGHVLTGSGALQGNTLAVAAGLEDDSFPQISQGTGASFFGAEWHNVVWRRDIGTPTERPWTRRVTTGGFAMTGALAVGEQTTGYFPTVSSTLAGPTLPDGTLPYVVSYRSEASDPFRTRIAVQGNSDGFGDTNLTESEGIQSAPLVSNAYVANLGHAFAVFSKTLSDELQLSTGALSHDPSGAVWQPAVGERAIPVSDGAWHTIASTVDGGGTSDGAVLLWVEGDIVEGVTFQALGSASLSIVGAQVCEALPNSTGERGWMNAYGNGAVHSPQAVYGRDLPVGAFGYLLVARDLGTPVQPAGSQGRICLGGSIGRYVNDIQTANASGGMAFTVSGSFLPSPNGFVSAQSGERWYFQVWHRDSSAGQATSNFTNAIGITFE